MSSELNSDLYSLICFGCKTSPNVRVDLVVVKTSWSIELDYRLVLTGLDPNICGKQSHFSDAFWPRIREPDAFVREEALVMNSH